MRAYILTLAYLLLLLPFAAHSQQEAQAGDEPIILTRQNRTRVINPGRRITLYGPPGTAPIKGKLVSAGDSITIRPDKYHLLAQQQKVAVTDIQAVGQRRLGWQIMTWYYSVAAFISMGIVLAFGLAGFVFLTGFLATILLVILLRYGFPAVVFAFLARPKYAMDKWKWAKRDNR